jgi:hypothetical protein
MFSQTARPTFGTRVAFGRHAQTADDRGPGTLTVKAAARRALMFREARELLTALPGPGECVHGVMLGTFDLMVLISAIIDMHPARCETQRIGTLTFNKRNAVEMLGLLESGKVGRLSLLGSTFLRGHYGELYQWFREELAAFPASKIACARNHCKIVCFDFADGTGMVLEGSANLRTNGNREQLLLANDRGLHDFHAGWLDALVSRNEGDESRSGPAD